MFYAPGNSIAYLALIAFPFLALYLFSRKSVAEAIVWTFVLGYLLLPVRTFIDPPLFPNINKIVLPALTALGLVIIFGRERLQILPRSPIARLFLVILILMPTISGLANRDPIVIGDTYLPGMSVFSGEGISLMMSEFAVLIPFILGRQFLADVENQRKLIKIIATCGVLYTFAIIWEIRLSPQLHAQLYGYFPHSFGQQMREGGFRAVVFLGHGLLTSLFLVITLVLLAYFARNQRRIFNLNAFVPIAFVLVAIAFNKTYAAYIYTMLAIGFCFFLSRKLRRLALVGISIFLISYPVFRSSDFYPDDQIVELAAGFSEDRASSLQFRYDNENILLEKIAERPFFGWGVWGRNRVYDENGNDISVTDGGWIIDLGIYGWIFYICKYTLMVWPIFLWVKIKKYTGDEKKIDEVTALSFIVGIVLFDNLINAGISPIVWLISGALMGAAERELYKSPAKKVTLES